MSSYSSMLRDRRWQKRRLEILQRDEFTCQNCASENDAVQLHVHHKAYLPQTPPWQYPDELLVTLCEECHRAETATKQQNEILWAAISGSMANARSVNGLLALLVELRDKRTDMDEDYCKSRLGEADIYQGTLDAMHIQGFLRGTY